MKSLNNIYTAIYPFLKNGYGIINKNSSKFYLFPPLRVTIELTYRCNMNCAFCYLSSQKEASGKKPVMQEELSCQEIINIIKQLPRHTLITFTGGEPFLRKDIMDILKFTAKRHKCTIITNGTLFSEKIIREIVKLKIPLLGISLDGIGDTHDNIRKYKGAFKKIADNIRLLQDYKKDKRSKYPMIDIKTVINSRNLGDLCKIMDFAENLNIENLTYQIIQTSIYTNIGLNITAKKEYLYPPPKLEPLDTDFLKKELGKINNRKKTSKIKIRFIPNSSCDDIIRHYSNKLNIRNFKCYAPWSMVRISAAGNVYPCFNITIGNIRQSNLRQLWQNARYTAFREELREAQIFPGCVGCCLLEPKRS